MTQAGGTRCLCYDIGVLVLYFSHCHVDVVEDVPK